MVGDASEILSSWPIRERVGDMRGARESFGVFAKASGGLLARFCLANSAPSSPMDGVVPGNEAVDSMSKERKGCHISMHAKGSGRTCRCSVSGVHAVGR